ncbi:MAG TPA: hypothetical protein VGJ29_10170 [Vicinamibacterales bacterium]|jgi:hypothetical protein
MAQKEVYMRAFWTLLLFGMAALCVTPTYAQGPPIHGFNGTIATEATVKAEHKAANKIVVETKDGVEHVYDAAKDVVVHGGTNPLSDLKPGTTVVIHYTADNTAQEIDRVGAGGLSTTEGIATKINRGKKEITIRYDNGRIEKLKLTDRAAADVGKSIGPDTRIVVYYSDDAGEKVTHYFKKSDKG